MTKKFVLVIELGMEVSRVQSTGTSSSLPILVSKKNRSPAIEEREVLVIVRWPSCYHTWMQVLWKMPEGRSSLQPIC